MSQTDVYAKMYAMVVCAASDAIDALEMDCPQHARKLLEDALNQAEDFYLEHWENSESL